MHSDTSASQKCPSILVNSPQDSLVAEEQFIELTVVSEVHVSHYRSHLGVGCLVVFDPYLHSDRTAQRESCPLHEHFSNAEKTLDEIEGQLFPEFDGTERPRAVCILGEEWAEGKLKALFFRVNNKLYAYVDDATRQAYGNICMGVPPPLPPRRTMKMLDGKMGPMLLHNTAYEVCKLYMRAAQEEPNCAPNVQEAQDLNLYLHLWNAHKQEKSNLIRIVMKGWRPLAWAAEAAKQKKMALREKGKAQAAQQTLEAFLNFSSKNIFEKEKKKILFYLRFFFVKTFL